MTRVVDFGDGFTSATEPTTEGSIASFNSPFANNAAYEAVHTAVAGSTYYDTTLNVVKVYDGSTWRTTERALDNATAADPTVNSDNTAGYEVLSLWLNTSSGAFFRAVSVATGAAVWQEVAADSVLDAHISSDGKSHSDVVLNNAHRVSTANPHSVGIDDITPTTTKGDIIVENGSNAVRFPVGTDTHVLTLDSTEATGLKWAAAAGSGTAVSVAYIWDQKAANTDAGDFTSGAWRTRDLNTESDPDGIVTILSNQFDLLIGDYFIEWSCPIYDIVTGHKTRLQNIDDATTAAVGTTEYSGGSSGGTTTRSSGHGYVSIAGTKTFEIQHRCGTTNTVDGFGKKSNFSTVEVYTIVKITKIG